MGTQRGKGARDREESGTHPLATSVELARSEDMPGAAGNGSPPGTMNGAVPLPQATPVARVGHRSGRPMTAEDLFRIKVVGEPALSPDGTRVAVAVTTIDAEANTYRSAIWMVPVEGGTPAQLTAGGKRDTSPRWSPDGTRLAFLSDRDTETPQLWLIPVGGGEARRVTDLENAVTDPVWSPDGRRVAFVSKLTPPDPNPGSDVKVITELRYKFDGEGFLGGKRRQIWSVDVDREDAEPKRVTDGDFEHSSPAWSPSGRELAFAANRNPGWQLERSRDLWSVVPGSPPRRLTDGSGFFDLPAWSPDGTMIVCTGHRKLRQEGPNHEVWVLSASGGEPRSLTAGFDRGVGDQAISDIGQFPPQRPRWSADGSALFFLGSDCGTTHVHRVDLHGTMTPLTAGARRVAAFDTTGTGETLVSTVSDPVTPFEIHALERGTERALTAFNADLLREVAVAAPEEIWVDGAGGHRVQGWILRPPAARPDVALPAILEIHGGPHTMYGTSFFHELQLLAARGYAVIYANPRGSTGYGEAFTSALHAAWGEQDTPDLMAVLDRAVAGGGIDPARLGVTGGSYGGYMTNWLLGQTDRFRAGVTQRSISNLVSLYGTDDIAVVSLDVEFGGPPWVARERYLALSPITYVERITAPLLILHSEEDYRCPIEQAEQLFVALKRLGREVVFVRFPGESHNLSRSGKPAHRLERLRRIVDWFDGHL